MRGVCVLGGMNFASTDCSIGFWNCSDSDIYIFFFYDYFYFFTIYGVILDSITLNPFQYLLLYNYFSISVGGLESIYS